MEKEHLLITAPWPLTPGNLPAVLPKTGLLFVMKSRRIRCGGEISIFKFTEANYDALYNKVTTYLQDKQIYVRDAYACANDTYKTTIRVVTEKAFQNLFANNMFLRFEQAELGLQPEWTIIAAPDFQANPQADGTRQENFSIINFTKKMILIGGSGYTGEIKKGIFSVLNFILPQQRKVLIHALFGKCG